MGTWKFAGRYLQQWYLARLHRQGRTLALAGLAALLLFNLSGNFVALAAAQAKTVTTHRTTKPNHFNPKTGTTSVLHRPHGPVDPPFHTSATPHPIAHPGPQGMRPGTLSFDPAKPSHFLSSDGALEITAAAGTFTAADLSAA